MKIILFIIFCFLFINCETMQPTGKQFSPTSDIQNNKGLVYIYRPLLFTGSGVYFTVKADGESLIELTNGTYKPFFIKPGEVTFEAETIGSAKITIQVNSGEVYYLKGNVIVGPLVGKPILTQVSKEIGEREISECKLKN